MSLSNTDYQQPRFQLRIEWRDESVPSVEEYSTREALNSRIAYLRQMDRTEQPSNWEVFDMEAPSEDQPVETGP